MSVEVPSTALELVQRLARDVGASGSDTNNIPTSLAGQTGEMARLIGNIQAAYLYIQSLHPEWGFLRMTATFPTVIDQAFYTISQCGIPTGTFGSWDRRSFRNYVTAVGLKSEIFMDYENYDYWRDVYQYGVMRFADSRPIQMTVRPSDKAIGLGPIPTADYSVLGDYYKAPMPFTGDNDVPVMGSLNVAQNLIVVAKAKMYYAEFEAASEVFQGGQADFKEMLPKLEALWLPEISVCGPLA